MKYKDDDWVNSIVVEKHLGIKSWQLHDNLKKFRGEILENPTQYVIPLNDNESVRTGTDSKKWLWKNIKDMPKKAIWDKRKK